MHHVECRRVVGMVRIEGQGGVCYCSARLGLLGIEEKCSGFPTSHTARYLCSGLDWKGREDLYERNSICRPQPRWARASPSVCNPSAHPSLLALLPCPALPCPRSSSPSPRVWQRGRKESYAPSLGPHEDLGGVDEATFTGRILVEMKGSSGVDRVRRVLGE